MRGIVNEFLEQFLIESRELIAQATDDLLALEHSPADVARFDSAFRAIHTLKGAAGIMDFEAMARISHSAEDLLNTIRSGTQARTPARITDCLACLDLMTAWLSAMEASETLPEGADVEAAEMIARLSGGHEAAPAQAPSPVAPALKPEQSGISPDAKAILQEQLELLCLPNDAGSAGRNAAAFAVIRNILRQFDPDYDAIGGTAMPKPASSPNNNEPSADSNATAMRPMRTDSARIDSLLRLSGELVVVKNALGHEVEIARQGGIPKQHSQNFTRLHGQLDRLSADLLHASVAARILPLRQVFQRFPRLVREMAAGLDKKIRLETEGDATEADRLIVEALFEPLLHVLRNAVDHGIEPPEQRAAAGKPIPAVIRLSAARLGEEVVIEIADDGRGIDPAAILATAEARGVASPLKLQAMAEEELLQLIFAPGFSTAGAVSNLSGRGVGMDAVRAAIEGLSGRVALQSRLGVGTVIRFHLPFTVLLTQVLNVEAGGQAFGIPFEAVAETLQFRPDGVMRIGAAETILWRGQTLPLTSLAKALHLPESPQSEDALHAVIIEHDGEFTALQVDCFGKPVEVMLKPLDGLLAGMRCVAGTALLGDGRVLIVLELQELLH
jgi:two-component system chemotaxis sensor kinase CheA